MRAYSLQVAAGKVTTPEDNNARDKAMAANLLHLINERYKDHRVIVWGANFHMLWDAPGVRWQSDEADMPGAYAKTVTMGTIVKQALKDDVYSMLFTAYQGQTGKPWANAAPLDAAGKGTFEHYMKKAGFKHAIVDFRSLKSAEDGTPHWLRGKLSARPLGYQPMTADWGAHCDAIFYSEVMGPSTKASLPKTLESKKPNVLPDDDAPTSGKPKF
jgi:erythromycin esterase-like protein